MGKQSEEYRAQMLRRLKTKYGRQKPTEVLEAEKVIADYREGQENAVPQIERLETRKCSSSVCPNCFYMRGISVHLKPIPSPHGDIDYFRCPQCNILHERRA